MKDPVHGSFYQPGCTVSGKRYKDVCDVKCDAGFVLDHRSATKVYCDKFGQWNFGGAFEPRCNRKCNLLTRSWFLWLPLGISNTQTWSKFCNNSEFQKKIFFFLIKFIYKIKCIFSQIFYRTSLSKNWT